MGAVWNSILRRNTLKKIIAILLLLLVVGCEEKEPTIEAIPEMARQLREKTEERDGVFYVKETGTPYSGKWYAVDAGAYGVATIKNGKIEGTSTWYRPNGVKVSEMEFKDGQLVNGSEKWWNSKGEPVDSEGKAIALPEEEAVADPADAP